MKEDFEVVDRRKLYKVMKDPIPNKKTLDKIKEIHPNIGKRISFTQRFTGAKIEGLIVGFEYRKDTGLLNYVVKAATGKKYLKTVYGKDIKII